MPLKNPVTGMSCCRGNDDCGPARGAYMDENEQWWVYDKGVPRPVPREAILNTVAPDAGSHVCINKITHKIDCFIRGLPKG